MGVGQHNLEFLYFQRLLTTMQNREEVLMVSPSRMSA
jgi:hypothetical protein